MVIAAETRSGECTHEREVPLGHITLGKGIYAKAKRWDEYPTVQWIMKREHRASVPLVYLFIMPEAVNMTLDDLHQKGFTLGNLVTCAEGQLRDLIEEFLPGVPVSQCKHQFIMGDLCEAVRVPHVGLLIGEQSLFLKYIRREHDLMIRPEVLIEEERRHLFRQLRIEHND